MLCPPLPPSRIGMVSEGAQMHSGYQLCGLHLVFLCSDQLQGPFYMKGGGLRTSWIHVWVGAWHLVSSGLCGLNECAVSIRPSIFIIKASLLSSPSPEGIREKLHQAFFFFSSHSSPTCHIHFSLTQPLLFIHCCCIPVTCKFPQGASK